MITIVDYGCGNIKAIVNIYDRLRLEVAIARTPGELRAADKIILPGVGAFDHVMARLDESGMRGVLDDLVKTKKRPVLGICGGMQIMASRSDEGQREGLRWLEGEVRRFGTSTGAQPVRLPQMGWNDVWTCRANGLFKNLEADAVFYFLHSYYLECSNARDVLAVAEYGKQFAAAVNADHIFGVQFHPEKSHRWGVQLLKNFGSV